MLNFKPEQTVKLIDPRKGAAGAAGAVGLPVPAPLPEPSPEPLPQPLPMTQPLPLPPPQPSWPDHDPRTGKGRGLRLDDTLLRRNQRSIEAHIDDDHYLRRFTPGQFALDAVSPTLINVPAASPRWSALSFAKAAAMYRATVNWDRPFGWRTGKMRIWFWYTSPVGSTNTFAIGLRIMAIRAGEVLPGTALLAALNVAHAGPAVANTVIRTGYTFTTTSFAQDDELFSLQIVRDGSHANDTNVNELHVIYAMVQHIPPVQELT